MTYLFFPEAKPLSAREYENYVAAVVSCMAVFPAAKISRNQKLAGIRQPGVYEIDIVVEFNLADALDFLVIIECKNWNRPVDRPVVQKLIQTAEAVSAHKAAIVSPIGFTSEAVDVAKAHGVALWILAIERFERVYRRVGYGEDYDYRPMVYQRLREELLQSLGLWPRALQPRPSLLLVTWTCLSGSRLGFTGPGGEWGKLGGQDEPEDLYLYRLPEFLARGLSETDSRLASAQVLQDLDVNVRLSMDYAIVSAWVSATRAKLEGMQSLELSGQQLDAILLAVLDNSRESFCKALTILEAKQIMYSRPPSSPPERSR